MNSGDPVRICVWSGPRNVSTALMYSFAQRPDTTALDEPLYGHYLKVTQAPHPHPEEVTAAMDCDGERVVREVVLGPCRRPVLFCKQMAHHLVELDWGFLDRVVNVLLVRDPREVLPSLARNLEAPVLRDTGFEIQGALFDRFQKQGMTIPVLDARELLLNPRGVLKELCRVVGIPFDERMLHWPAGPKPEDGVWAKYWYHNLHRSTGFMPYRSKTEPFPQRLQPLLEECLPFYRRLYAHAVKADEAS